MKTFTDSRDGKIYKTVRIGSQKNLAFKTNESCWAYNDNPANINIYGCLYTWDAALKTCPLG